MDLSPTKHVVMLLIAALLCLATMFIAARGAVRQTEEHGHTSGFAGAVETVVLFVRNEVVIPNVGPHGEGFAPFVLTLFFFILYANLLGLIPYGSTATGNICGDGDARDHHLLRDRRGDDGGARLGVHRHRSSTGRTTCRWR